MQAEICIRANKKISKFQKKENIFLLGMPPRSANRFKLRTAKRAFSPPMEGVSQNTWSVQQRGPPRS